MIEPGVEPACESRPRFFGVLSIPRTTQHGSSVNKGCSVSASGCSIINGFNCLLHPPPLLPLPHYHLLSFTPASLTSTAPPPPHLTRTSTNTHTRGSGYFKHASCRRKFDQIHGSAFFFFCFRQNINEQSSAIWWTDPGVSTGTEKHHHEHVHYEHISIIFLSFRP